MPKLLVRTVIGLAIGGLFVWLSARDWPMDELSGAMRIESGHLVVGAASVPEPALAGDYEGAAAAVSGEVASGWLMDLDWLLPYLLILTLIHFLRVVRWKPLLDPIVELDLRAHNRIGAVGFMAMFLFPLRLGELVRPYLVKRATSGVRMTEVLATVVVERVIDGLMVSLLLFAVLPWLPTSDGGIQTSLLLGAFGALGVFLGATVLLAVAVWKQDVARALVDRTVGLVSSGLSSRINDLVEAFLRGLEALPNRRSFLWFLLLTAIYWGANGLGVWAMARAFYLPVDLVGSYAMMACVVVGMMIPNSPGNVGSFWYFLLVPLGLYGVSTGSAQGIAFGVMVWFLQLVQQTAFGAWFVITGRDSVGELLEAAQGSEAALTSGETTEAQAA